MRARRNRRKPPVTLRVHVRYRVRRIENLLEQGAPLPPLVRHGRRARATFELRRNSPQRRSNWPIRRFGFWQTPVIVQLGRFVVSMRLRRLRRVVRRAERRAAEAGVAEARRPENVGSGLFMRSDIPERI